MFYYYFFVAKNVKTKVRLLNNFGCGSARDGSGSDWESSHFRKVRLQGLKF